MDEGIAQSWEEAADSGVGNRIHHTRGALKQSVRLTSVGKSVVWKVTEKRVKPSAAVGPTADELHELRELTRS